MKRVAPMLVLALAAASVAWLRGDAAARLVPRRALVAPSWQHPFGCGQGGIDLLGAVGQGVIGSLCLAITVTAFGALVGVLLGAAVGIVGGALERGMGRLLDVVQSLPSFFVALALLTAVREPSRWHLGVVFAATAWIPFARLALAEARVLRGMAFVQAAEALGRTPASIVLRHVVPQLLPMAWVQSGASAAAIVVGEAGLAFLGFVAQQGAPSLGQLLGQGVTVMLVAPHVLVVAALAVLITNAVLLRATTRSA